MPKKPYYTASEVARLLGITACQVRVHAREKGIGTLRGYGSWEFTQEDLNKLRKRPGKGRPKA